LDAATGGAARRREGRQPPAEKLLIIGTSVLLDCARRIIVRDEFLSKANNRTLESSGFTAVSLNEVRAKLAEYGLSLAGE
jgi:hypothetical protein